uniref:AlNc14C226G9219 protein n=1 Tax=Albugo laibachii Nc14 TaxID=890382 RepID=F0WS81_9STRA|nr:AlNc14C226G9219 [Albugo laibachii Nc14]|eukprot:CCA24199.1 AlNc14C226G9219 [Albugo laibachii Nc14]
MSQVGIDTIQRFHISTSPQELTIHHTLSIFPPFVQETLIVDDIFYAYIGRNPKFLSDVYNSQSNQEDADPFIASLDSSGMITAKCDTHSQLPIEEYKIMYCCDCFVRA